MDWGAGHLAIIVGMGSRAFANNFFKCPRYARGFARGGEGVLVSGIDSHIIPLSKFI